MTLGVLVGYDGSPAAGAAIDVGAVLLPGARAWVTYLWVPPFASDEVRRRLWEGARDVNSLVELVEREGEREAQRIARMGVTLARAAGWEAEPLLERTWSSEATRIAAAAGEVGADLVVMGSRGLGGTQALLGSVSDMVVHYSDRPVLVVRHPMLSAEFDALPDGPVVLGWDGSAGSHTALAAARRLLPGRRFVAVSVGEDTEAGDVPVDGAVEFRTVDRGRGFGKRSVAGAVIDAATDAGAALIVVGSRGQSAAREIMLGSVAKGTLHQSHRPVMVVPGEAG